MNGDGSPDILNTSAGQGNPPPVRSIANFNNTHTPVDILSSITLSGGGQVSAAYKPSTQYLDGSGNLLNPSLPLVIETVSQVTVNDGSGNTATTNYSYSGGSYYFNSSSFLDRKFAGFSTITKTDPAGHTTKTYFHQGNGSDSNHGEYGDEYWKIGKPYRAEVANSSGSIYAKTINKWDSYNLGNGRKFVKLAQTVNLAYDGDSPHRDAAESYTYDNIYGNQSQKVQWGEVIGSDDGTFADTGTDRFTTSYTYAANAGAYIVGLLSQATTTDQTNTKIRETKNYYDTVALGSVTLGNLTRQENWKNLTAYTHITKSYNAYGLVTQDKDERDKATNYIYDGYNLYPITVTNPLNQITRYTYNYPSGQVKQITDPNKFIFQNAYDGLGRLTSQLQPDLASPTTLVTKTSYSYTDDSGVVSVKRTDYLDATNTTDGYVYFDGLGRKLQERKAAEGGNFATRDYAYNNRGLLDKESLSYFSSGSARTTATSNNTLYITYGYDALQRVIGITNAVGTTTNVYNDWKLTVTDPRNKSKNFYKDAYNHLIKVEELNSGNTYTTSYL